MASSRSGAGEVEGQRHLAALALGLDRGVERAQQAGAVVVSPKRTRSPAASRLPGFMKAVQRWRRQPPVQGRLDAARLVAAQPHARQPRRDHPGVVEHQHVAGRSRPGGRGRCGPRARRNSSPLPGGARDERWSRAAPHKGGGNSRAASEKGRTTSSRAASRGEAGSSAMRSSGRSKSNRSVRMRECRSSGIYTFVNPESARHRARAAASARW